VRIILAAIASALALLPGLAAAHPLGNFSVNRFSRLEPGPGRIGVHFVVDMAEIPAFQELSRLGAVDGRLAPETAERYARARADALREQLKLTVDGQPAPLAVTALRVTLAPGQGGLRTLRLEVDLEAPARPPA
jgi:nickel/cobalt exporter